MIYVLEIPHQRVPRCWIAEDRTSLIRRVTRYHSEMGSGSTLYDCSTVAKLSEQFHSAPWLAREADDTKMYCSDFAGPAPAGDYTKDPISEWDACIAYLEHDLHALRIYETDADALAAAADNSEWAIHQGGKARSALRAALTSIA